jgi:hypothetical protein
MNNSVFFDHIEVHVEDVERYCIFLKELFQGGRYNVISESGTSMFVSNDGINFEIKKKKGVDTANIAGFCNPCLRMEHAKFIIQDKFQFTISKTVINPDGKCYFFKDHEGIQWHIKEYLVRDKFINW